MAQGNAYILIPEAAKNNPVPARLRDKWNFREQVLDQNGDPTGQTQQVHPSWMGAANRLKKDFGEIIPVTYGGEDFQIIELELSWVHDEVNAVKTLQLPQPAKVAHFALLTNTEARRLVAGEDIFQG